LAQVARIESIGEGFGRDRQATSATVGALSSLSFRHRLDAADPVDEAAESLVMGTRVLNISLDVAAATSVPRLTGVPAASDPVSERRAPEAPKRILRCG
jgi:hypothetical protein